MAMTSAEIEAAIAEGKAAVDSNDWSTIKSGIASSTKGADVRKHIYAEAHAASLVVEEATEAMADYPQLKSDLTDFYFKCDNPLVYKDYLETVADSYVNRNNGQIITGQTGNTTVYHQKIDSTYGKITFNNIRSVAFYDSSKTFISGLAGNESGTLTEDIPANAVYISYSWKEASNDTFWVCYGETTSEPLYEIGVKTEFENRIESLEDDFITNADRVGFLSVGTNLFNKNEETQDTYLNNDTGEAVEYAGYCTSDYIKVSASVSYICNKNLNRYVLYNTDKTVLSSSSSNLEVITPTYDGYIRFSYYSPSSDKHTSNELVFIEGTEVPTSYSSYCFYPNSTNKYPVDFNATWWKDKYICTFGDSNTANERWQSYMCNKLGCTYQNCGIGGTAMAGTDSSAMWQDARVNTISTDTKAVLIMAGTNDAAGSLEIGDYTLTNTDTSTFVGAYNTCLTKIIARMGGTYPIFLFTPIPCFDTTTYPRVKEISEAVRNIGAMWSLPVIDAQNESGLNAQNWSGLYASDGVHVDYAGGKLLASLVVGVLKSHEPID